MNKINISDYLPKEIPSLEELDYNLETFEGYAEAFNENVTALESFSVTLERLETLHATLAQQDPASVNHALSLEACMGALTPLGRDPAVTLEAMGANATDPEVSLEGVSDLIKKVGNGFSNAFNKTKTAMADMLASITGMGKKFTMRLEAAQKELQALTGEPKTDEITFKAMHRLQCGGKTDMASINEGLENLVSVAGEVTRDLPEAYMKYARDVTKSFIALKSRFKRPNAINSALNDYKEEIHKLLEKSLSNIGEKPVEFSGGFILSTDEGSTKSFYPEIRKADRRVKSDAKATIKTPTVAELQTMMDHCAKAVEIVVANRRPMNDLVDSVEAEADKVFKEMKSFDRNIIAKWFAKKDAEVILSSFHIGLVAQPMSEMVSITFRSGRAALGLVEQTVKAY